MKKYFVAVFALFLAFSFSNSFAQEEGTTNNEEQIKMKESLNIKKMEMNDSLNAAKIEVNDSLNIEEAAEGAVTKEKLNTICPVSNEDADPEVTYTYNGKTYSLCCNKCLKKFKANPEKYISRMEKEKSEVVN